MARLDSQTTIVATLADALDREAEGDLLVAFSGGSDSSVLLDALARLPQARERHLQAIHIDHGIHPSSAQWAQQCRLFCQSRHIPLTIRRIDLAGQNNLEKRAREARYAIFADHLPVRGLLVTAHHQADQTETILLKLLRGASPAGLGGMRRKRPFKRGFIWRPLLTTPKAEVDAYGRDCQLPMIADPSNQNQAYARNFLRHSIIPHLEHMWPGVSKRITHAAPLYQHLDDYMHRQALKHLVQLVHPLDYSLDGSAWLKLHEALHMPVLQAWLSAQGYAFPDTRQLSQIKQQLRQTRGDRIPLLRWQDVALHIWQQRLYVHLPLTGIMQNWAIDWSTDQVLELADGSQLTWQKSKPLEHQQKHTLHVVLNRPGVSLKPCGDRHTRTLKNLLNQAAIPPWHRPYCPLIYSHENVLLSAAGLWQTSEGNKLFNLMGGMPKWHLPAGVFKWPEHT